MEILFNKDNRGQLEIKETLGWLDGNFTYSNLEPDIKLNTPHLIDVISQEVYDKVLAYYKNPDSVADEALKKKLQSALHLMQVYVLSFAYLDYAPNNDLTHGNQGRMFSSEENEKLPWEWQINKDNSAIKSRAYKALDNLIRMLSKEEWTEWTNSSQYKETQDLFVKNSDQLFKIYRAIDSPQLYYKLVPFMHDLEEDEVRSILGTEKFTALKTVENPTDEEKDLIQYARKGIIYKALAKAYKTFPIEMFPDKIDFRKRYEAEENIREKMYKYLEAEGRGYLKKLEYTFENQNQTFEQLPTMQGLQEGTKHVSL